VKKIGERERNRKKEGDTIKNGERERGRKVGL
jgi:hypothetical protein